ncbi:winged helix-turn-helix domain-containing protein [Knoellia sp. GCM10027209]|uniref:winged helix-turn-helix domain-containing protein n=1 Tax=Knoellia sp. GCM10027209 TaxID=3273396 RepID=UPI00360D7968
MSPPGARPRRPEAAVTEASTGPGRLSRPRLYEQLADHIGDFIDAQGLVPGDRLPPERSLAKDLGVSRATLSRALVALEVRGRVEVRHGDGAVVRDPAAAAELPPLAGAGVGELRRARAATMAALAREAAGHPDASLRAALLADDGTTRSLDDVWGCVLRLVATPSLLGELDLALANRIGELADDTPEPAAVAGLARAVRSGRADLVADACSAVLGLRGG